MVAVFFRRTGPVAIVPIEKGKTVNAQWYTETCLSTAFAELEQQRPKTCVRGILLHQDNARPHVAARTLDFLHHVGVQLLPHPPYSPDLAPCDLFLFPEVKQKLKGKRFESSEAAVAVFHDILSDMTKNDFKACFDNWFLRMHKCISARGEYFEKL